MLSYPCFSSSVAKNMNFILFNPDELRAESVGSYGHPLAPTPNMDALGR